MGSLILLEIVVCNKQPFFGNKFIAALGEFSFSLDWL